LKKVYFKTFGCRTNIYDTQVMIESLKDFEVVKDESLADIVVVNSCTVTNGADSGVRSYINSLNREKKRVIIAGCGAFSRGSELFKDKKVFGVMGHSKKENINELLHVKEPFVELGDLNSIDSTIVSEYIGKNKAFLKIQEGCNFRCSYCIIPHVRGNARSQDEDKILEQVKKLAYNGYKEFVLTGTNIGSYGQDKKSSLGNLVKKISKIRGVKRIRLGSIEPMQVDKNFEEILDEPWLEKHLHIALQHTNEEMLKIMRRRNSVKRDLELFWKLSEKGFALGTDFIVGHPGESEDIWLDAYARLKEFPLTHIHSFVYSKRDGTPSSKMKFDVRGDIAKKRLKLIDELVNEKNYEFRLKYKNTLEVLVEEKRGEYFVGYDQFYNRVFIKSNRDIDKKWVSLNNYEVKKEANYAEF